MFRFTDGPLQLELTLVRDIPLPGDSPEGLAFSPDGRWLAAGRTLRIFDAETFEVVAVDHNVTSLEGLEFLSDGRLVAAQKYFTTLVLDVPELHVVAEVAHRGGFVVPNRGAGEFYKSSYNDNDVLRVSDDGTILSRFDSNSRWGAALDVDDGALYVVNGDWQPPGLQVLDAQTLTLRREIQLGLDEAVVVIPLTPAGQALVIGCTASHMVGRIVDVTEGRIVAEQDLRPFEYPCTWSFGYGAQWADVDQDTALLRSQGGILIVDRRTGHVHVTGLDVALEDGRIVRCCEIAYDATRGRIALSGFGSPFHGWSIQVFDLVLTWNR